MKKVLVLYPHQLYQPELLPEVDVIFVVEEPRYFGRGKDQPENFHKQKLILHRASLRRYVEEVLWPNDYQVEYLDLDVLFETGDILDKIGHVEQLFVFDPVDEVISSNLLQARRSRPNAPEITFLPTPNFYLKEQEVRQYFAGRHKYPFSEFYQWQRERFNILIAEDYKPAGGAWMLETAGLHAAGRITAFPSFSAFGDNKFVKDAVDYVDKHFPENPGSTDFIWPTNHEEAAAWLQDFVQKRLDDYAPYHDAISPSAVWLHHSALSSSLNIGLLSPQQVVDAALRRHTARPVPLPSLELFIRNVLGKREFDRGLYLTKRADMEKANPFRQHRQLTPAWFQNGVGIPPFDDLLKKLHDHAYVHMAERNLIAGSLMMLCEIHPDMISRWYREFLIDAYDWSIEPIIYGYSQVGDGGLENPVIVPSNLLIQASDYNRGEWSDIWDGLFWRFVDKHRANLSHNAHMRTMITRLGRLDPDRRRIITYRAETS